MFVCLSIYSFLVSFTFLAPINITPTPASLFFLTLEPITDNKKKKKCCLSRDRKTILRLKGVTNVIEMLTVEAPYKNDK